MSRRIWEKRKTQREIINITLWNWKRRALLPRTTRWLHHSDQPNYAVTSHPGPRLIGSRSQRADDLTEHRQDGASTHLRATVIVTLDYHERREDNVFAVSLRRHIITTMGEVSTRFGRCPFSSHVSANASLGGATPRPIVFIATPLFTSVPLAAGGCEPFCSNPLAFSLFPEVSLRDEQSTRFAVYHANPRDAERKKVATIQFGANDKSRVFHAVKC